MKVYEWNAAPNCRRLRMFLEEKQLWLPTVECVSPGLSLSASYCARYQHRLVPMLELDDGTQIGEVQAIWTYLESLYPDPALMGRTPLEKAIIGGWERRALDEGMTGYAEIFRNSHPSLVDRGLAGYGQPVPQIPALVERGRLRASRFQQMFDGQLSDRKFVAGDSFTVADITAISSVGFGHLLGIQIPENCRHLRRWYDDMQEIESVRKSLPTRDADGTLIQEAK
jgi:glutathione S-transferase